MALTPQDETQLESLFGSANAAADAFDQAKKTIGHLRLTKCDPSDIGVEPAYKEYPLYDLYLLDTSDHCAHVITDPAKATGLIVVRKKAVAK